MLNKPDFVDVHLIGVTTGLTIAELNELRNEMGLQVLADMVASKRMARPLPFSSMPKRVAYIEDRIEAAAYQAYHKIKRGSDVEA